MAQLAALIVTNDDEFRRQISNLLRAGGVPIGIVEDTRAGIGTTEPDLALVDLRHDAPGGMAAIERMRAAHPTAAIFAIAVAAEPEQILQAMRAGANEFFTWPPQQDGFFGALRRTAARRETTHA